MDPVHEGGPWTRSKEGVHGPGVHVLSSPFGEYTDRLITTGNRQQTTTDPVHSHGKINRSRHRHRLKKGLRWLTFSTDVSKLLIIGCFVCIHDRHHFLTLCQIYSITDKVQHSLQTRNLNLTATNEIMFADR